MNPEARLDHDANVKGRPDYRTGPPNGEARQKLKFMAALQFLLPGAPYIYYGTEAGMWGADDPDCRKPMIWPDSNYDDEAFLPTQKKKLPVRVAFDTELHQFYQTLCNLRRNRAVWRRGNFQILSTGERWFVFSRTAGNEGAVVVVNAGKRSFRAPASRFFEEGGGPRKLSSPTHPQSANPAADLVVEPWGIVILEES
jgi:glycosidase